MGESLIRARTATQIDRFLRSANLSYAPENVLDFKPHPEVYPEPACNGRPWPDPSLRGPISYLQVHILHEA